MRAPLLATFAVVSVIGLGLGLSGSGCAPEGESAPPVAAEPGRGGAAQDRGGDIWGAGYFPETELITHEGRKVRFFSDLIRGKVVAINFIYTSCPDACPAETARMMEVQRVLSDRLGKDVFFYSISIDPENDTPEVLATYVQKWGIQPGWTFLTGKKEEIDALRRKLGVLGADPEEARPSKHDLSLLIGNQATGRWMKRSPYENPYVLATQLGSWLHNWKLPPEGDRNYADAPPIRQIGAGENLFRTRCSSCHTVGQGETNDPAARRVGPDLYNITRLRDRAWLRRWIIEPDKVLAEGDPAATALLAQYNGIQMPNLRMTEVDADNVLRFLEEESARIDADLDRRLPAPAAPATP